MVIRVEGLVQWFQLLMPLRSKTDNCSRSVASIPLRMVFHAGSAWSVCPVIASMARRRLSATLGGLEAKPVTANLEGVLAFPCSALTHIFGFGHGAEVWSWLSTSLSSISIHIFSSLLCGVKLWTCRGFGGRGFPAGRMAGSPPGQIHRG
ncbi:MAG: hypothetical protein IPO55_00250 [Alphaproteobacteria bacterium]|nr:hypothetical protein [Alphaproteobacteria bacterium]